MFTWSLFVATTILGAPPSVADPVAAPPTHGAVEDSLSVQEILTQFQKEKSSSDWFWAHSKVRMECLVKLMRIGPAAVLVLIECLNNEKGPPPARALAAQALGFLADARARLVLLRAIEDKDRFVAAHARYALGRLGRHKATPKLRELARTAPDGSGYFDSMFILTRDDEPNPEPIRKALRDYNLARMDSAHLGKPAPDFTLEDASGKTWHLRQFRGKKAVVLIFLAGIN